MASPQEHLDSILSQEGCRTVSSEITGLGSAERCLANHQEKAKAKKPLAFSWFTSGKLLVG